MAQTAVDILMESIYGKDFRLKVSDGVLNMYQIAIEIQKEQISQGYMSGLIDGMNQQPKEYYKQTYGKE